MAITYTTYSDDSAPLAPSPDTVCAVAVSYHPSPSFYDRAESIIQQCGHLIIISTGASDKEWKQLEQLVRDNPSRITTQRSPENNLAMAQNIGIRMAQDKGFCFVLLLDDDSEPAPAMVSGLLTAYAQSSRIQRIGLIAPHVIERNSARETHYVRATAFGGFVRQKASDAPLLYDAFNIIASGSLIPLAVIDAVGEMDVRFGIDYVDKEFCLRLLVKGYRTVVVSDAKLFHSVGKSKDHEVMGGRVTATNHPPARRFTIYRNRLRCWGRHGKSCPSFVVFDALGMAYDLFRIVAFEDMKGEKLKAILRGACHALVGR